jgi:hypothetical protein
VTIRLAVFTVAVEGGAHSRTGVAAADFSRIRNADLERFTVDRLMSIINRLGSRVQVRVRVRRVGNSRSGSCGASALYSNLITAVRTLH